MNIKKREWFVDAGLIFGALLFTIILVEVGIRCVGYQLYTGHKMGWLQLLVPYRLNPTQNERDFQVRAG